MDKLEAQLSSVLKKLKKECVKQNNIATKLISKRIKMKPNFISGRMLEFESIERVGCVSGLDYSINKLELVLEKYRRMKPNDTKRKGRSSSRA